MKKYITFLLLILLMPILVFAKEESQTLSEALKDEEIEAKLEGYDDNEEKPAIYLFRGQGCSHCHEFLEYVSSELVKNKGDKFRLVSYEVWENKDNANLMQEVAEKFGEDASGVPFIVIGDKTFSGYSTDMNKDIEEAIDKLNESDEKVDVIKDNQLISGKTKKEDKKDVDNTSIIVIILLSSIALIVLVVTSFRKKEVA